MRAVGELTVKTLTENRQEFDQMVTEYFNGLVKRRQDLIASKELSENASELSRDYIELVHVFMAVAVMEFPNAEATPEQQAAGLRNVPFTRIVDDTVQTYKTAFNRAELPVPGTVLEENAFIIAVRYIGNIYGLFFSMQDNGKPSEKRDINYAVGRFCAELHNKGVKGFEAFALR